MFFRLQVELLYNCSNGHDVLQHRVVMWDNSCEVNHGTHRALDRVRRLNPGEREYIAPSDRSDVGASPKSMLVRPSCCTRLAVRLSNACTKISSNDSAITRFSQGSFYQ